MAALAPLARAKIWLDGPERLSGAGSDKPYELSAAPVVGTVFCWLAKVALDV